MSDNSQTTNQAEKTIGDMIDFIALNNHLIQLQDQVIKLGDILYNVQKRLTSLEAKNARY